MTLPLSLYSEPPVRVTLFDPKVESSSGTLSESKSGRQGRNSRALEDELLPVLVLVDGLDPGLIRVALASLVLVVKLLAFLRLTVSPQSSTAVDEVPESLGTQVGRRDAEDERDGVHEVGLARPVGADDGGEGLEGPDGLMASPGPTER